MRQSVIKYLQSVLEKYPAREPIYEIGSFRVSGQEKLANMRPYFPVGMIFVGCDIRKGPGVDSIENAEHLSMESDSVGTLICLDTLEHVQDTLQAMREFYRVLIPGGLCVITSVMNFGIHDYPSDYWRFTPEAFRFMLKQFSEFEVVSDGNPTFPVGVYGYGIKGGNVGAH